METKETKITIGDLTFWTRPWGEGKAVLTANETSLNHWLYNVHKEHPDVFEILQDDEDFCEEDMDGAFSVIVDPEVVTLQISPGEGKFGFSVARECNGDCENCEYNDCKDREEETNG